MSASGEAMTAAERAKLIADLDDCLERHNSRVNVWQVMRRCRAALESAPADTAREGWPFILAALLKEQKRIDRAAEMFPQVAEEHAEDRKAMRNVLATVRYAMAQGMPLPTAAEIALAAPSADKGIEP